MEQRDRSFFDEINDYHFGNLSAQDKLLFDSRLIIDLELAAAYEEFSDTLKIIKQQNIHNLKNDFQLLDAVLDKEFLSNQKRKPVILYIAATLVVLLSISMIYFHQNKLDNPAKAYYEKDIGLPVVMGENNNIQLDRAMSFYKLNDYEKAKNILTLLSNKKPTDTLTYYIGVNNYELGQYKNAINFFKKVDKQSSFYDKAQYRLGLSYWQVNEIDSTRQVFSNLKSPSSSYSVQAELILKKIK
jgi:tetratricopeptide (TPR) repeat protein